MTQSLKFFQLLNDAGQLPSIVNRELALVIDSTNGVIRDHAIAATQANDKIGATLAALEAWGKEDTSPVKPTLPPGMVVVDNATGEPSYTGPIDPPTMSIEDWQVYSQNYEKIGLYAVFSSSPVGKEKDPATGRDLHQGDLAQTVDLVAYKAKGGRLAPYL